MKRQPPACTTFPYTTLFRSGNFTGVGGEDITFGPGDMVLTPLDTWHNHGNVGKDRKSTRLNSSHVSISYAVFCFKIKHPPIDQLLCQHEHPVANTPHTSSYP